MISYSKMPLSVTHVYCVQLTYIGTCAMFSSLSNHDETRLTRLSELSISNELHQFTTLITFTSFSIDAYA